jgi:hypothetical protein
LCLCRTSCAEHGQREGRQCESFHRILHAND